MDRSKNSDGTGDEFTTSKKRGKKKTVSKDKKIASKRIVNKRIHIRKMQTKTLPFAEREAGYTSDWTCTRTPSRWQQ